MSEKPVERLNYYNGQRLEARDFKLEQEYHIRVRRWLNKSLYSAGIASGLEVRKEPDTLNVIVSPGLALDAEGREILLWEEQRVPVQSQSGSSDATVEGNYLVIEYRDEKLGNENGACSAGGKKNGRLAWGGPTRIRSLPLLSWSSVLPHESSGKIVLAQVELEPLCAGIRQVNTSVRRYVGAASEAKVRQYALDGERDIDPANPGRIYFHIRGRQPNAVTLYLRAEKFSTLYYTEMGGHDHSIDVNVDSLTIPAHSHSLTVDPATGGTGLAGGHNHVIDDIRANIFGVLNSPSPWGLPQFVTTGWRQASLRAWAGMIIDIQATEDHSHSIPTSTNADPAKTVSLSGSGGSTAAGVSDLQARTGTTARALTFVDNLQVFIGKSTTQLENKTPEILSQLRAAQSIANWPQLGLGTGSGTDTLATDGTGPIKLDFLPDIAFTEGEYVIELRVASGGGRILYNLYVE